MSDQIEMPLSSQTPEDCIARFREGVEDSDQAVPVLVVEYIDDQGNRRGTVAILAGPASPPDMIEFVTPEIRKLGDVRTAIFHTEVWVRAETNPETGVAEETMQEAAMVHCVSKEAPEWGVTQRFVRTRDGVTWLEEPRVIRDGVGMMQLGGRVSDLLKELTA